MNFHDITKLNHIGMEHHSGIVTINSPTNLLHIVHLEGDNLLFVP